MRADSKRLEPSLSHTIILLGEIAGEGLLDLKGVSQLCVAQVGERMGSISLAVAHDHLGEIAGKGLLDLKCISQLCMAQVGERMGSISPTQVGERMGSISPITHLTAAVPDDSSRWGREWSD
jgi:hypothetical protein